MDMGRDGLVSAHQRRDRGTVPDRQVQMGRYGRMAAFHVVDNETSREKYHPRQKEKKE